MNVELKISQLVKIVSNGQQGSFPNTFELNPNEEDAERYEDITLSSSGDAKE